MTWVVRITGRNACATVAVLLVLSSRANAEPQQLALHSDGTRLLISNMPRIASPAIELTSEDAVPIVWFYGNAKTAELPLVLMPGAVGTIELKLIKKPRPIVIEHQNVPQIRVEPAAYAKSASWRPTSSPAQRRTTLLLAVAMGTTLLLASLARRGAAWSVATVAIAWGVALAIASTSRAPLIEHDDADGTHWFFAVEPQVLRVPVASTESLVPIVESVGHLKELAPRIVVDGMDATIEFDLAKDAKVGVRRIPR